jgi:molybdopterin-guanine dinucleotide biosynthesis protein A
MTGVVLAGGASRRMGTDKALLDWHGRALVDHVAERIRPACAHVLLASGDGRRLGRPGEIADAVADTGPLGGLLAGLEAAVTPLVALVAVDMPHANAVVLRALAAVIGEADAAVPLVNGRIQPLHAVYRTTCAEPLRAYLHDGGRAVMGFLERSQVVTAGGEVWIAADPAGRFAANLNAPEDITGAR